MKSTPGGWYNPAVFACLIERHGGPEALRWAECPDPVPGPGEVLIELKAAALNHLDIWVRNGTPAYKTKLPHILGSDGAGTVSALGEGVRAPAAGTRVFIAPGLSCGACEFCRSGRDNQCTAYGILGAARPGTYGQKVVVPAANAIPLSEKLSFEEGAAFPLTFLTAWHMLVSRAGLTSGQTVLIVGANSGVGSAAIQIAREAGARVLATASSPEKAEKARSLGAEAILNHREPGWSHKAREATQGRGVDVVFEHVGPATWSESVKSLAPCGSIVTCGSTTGPEVALDLRYVFSRDLSIHGARMGTRAELAEVTKRLVAGKLKVVIGTRFPAREAASAQRLMESGGHFGKIVLNH